MFLFLIGLIVGAFAGVGLMALLQAKKGANEEPKAECLDCLITERFHVKEEFTNGDVIKALFPDVKIYRGGGYTGVLFQGGVTFEDMDGEWWNAPYERGSEK